ncbi:hypothetical protein [Geoalkalibacter ferrihydriticus]|uniref:hypothetical protein n=1 Tax=Geoalkalibacter ferrihydriticus TaxID=392333 RepID=UPI001ABF45F4|nr:hypothetical protein [Geoalkalibacter ferrihydriticus]
MAQAEEQERQLKKAVTGHLDSWIGRPVGSALDKAVTALLPRQWLENAPRISPTQPGYANIRIDESTGKIAPQTRLSQVQLHIQQEQGCLACHQR